MKSDDALMVMVVVLSLPVRGAWIEIQNAEIGTRKNSVAPRKGSVD